MWLITPRGFWSVVAHRDDANLVLVRSRRREDLEALRAFLPGLAPFEDPSADYRWRAVVTRQDWARTAAALSSAIDYPNMKDAVADPMRHDILTEVWASLARLQDEADPPHEDRKSTVARSPAIQEQLERLFDRMRIPQAVSRVLGADSGRFHEHGWQIGFLWGRRHGREYLQLFRQHRMTTDSHIRIWDSGEIEDLPAPSSMFWHVEGETAAERKQRQQQFFMENESRYAALRAKGLLPPLGFGNTAQEINEFLAKGGDIAGTERSRSVDRAVAVAVERAADVVKPLPDNASFLERLLVDAVSDAWRDTVPDGHARANVRLPVPGWDPQPGHTDLILGFADEPEPAAVAELKIFDVEQTLWDARKLVSVLEGRPAVRRAYLIVATTPKRWREAEVAALFEPVDQPDGGTLEWDTGELIERWARSWAYLLEGGRARPRDLPARIRTRFITARDVTKFPGYEVRCIAVEPVDTGTRQRFGREGWPVTGDRSPRGYVLRDVVLGYVSAQAYRDVDSELQGFHARRARALQKAAGVDLSSPPGEADQGLIALLRAAEHQIRVLASPFADFFEATPPVAALYSRHATLADRITDLREGLVALMVEIVAEVWNVDPEDRIPERRLTAAGWDPSEAEPDPLDYF